jgi:hypothetical protein
MLHDEVLGVAFATPAASYPNSIASPSEMTRRASRAAQRPAAKTACPDKVLQAFNTWAFKREQPSNVELMRAVVAAAIADERPVPFVLYWGKGPRRHVADPDLACLDYLADLARRVRGAYPVGAAITLIFTDTHARLNGHCADSMRDYFHAVEAIARERGFATCRLGDLTRAVEAATLIELGETPASDDVLRRLAVCAAKWYRGDGSAEEGALKYYEMNMIEKRAVELAFPGSIFVTFNGSEFRCLFPDRLPVFHMYSLRRGISVKPWFLPQLHAAATAERAG